MVRSLIKILFLLLATFLNCICFAGNSMESYVSLNDGKSIITLSEGLKSATENNRLIKIAFHTKEISSTEVLVAKSRLFPSINATLNQTYLSYQPGAWFDSLHVYTAEKESLSYGINVYQTLYDFGSNISQYGASKIALDVATLDILRIKNIVALDFIYTYFDLLETEKMLFVSQREVESLESHLKVAQSLYAEGAITKNDLLQAEVTLSDAKQRLLTMKNIRSITASKMNNILGRPLNTEIHVVDMPLDPHTQRVLELEKAWEIAEKQRAEVKIIDNELRIIDMEKIIKKSEYYPTVFAQGGYNYTENRYLLHEDNWSLIFGVNLNVFSGGSTKAKVSKVEYRRNQLLEQKKKLIEDIQLGVEKSYRDMNNALEKIKVTKDATSQAEENLRINKIRYEEGIGTSTDVLDAITLLAKAETNYYSAVYELNRAQAGLLFATGSDLVSVYSH